MKPKEKIIAIAIASAAALFGAYVLLDSLLLSPAGDLDAAADKARREIAKLTAYNARKGAYRERLAQLREESFGADVILAGEQVRDRLMTILVASGLASEDHALHPTAPGSGRKPYREIGRTISARGALVRVMDFLYLVSADKYMHRLEGLSLKPELTRGEVAVHVRYTTLAMTKAKPAAGAAASAEAPIATLGTKQHRAYGVIAARNLFRPYIKPKPPVYVRPTPRPRPRPAPSPSYSVVGLPSWPGRKDVYVRDNLTGRTKVYDIGDELAGGRIVMIDYRLLPKLDKPELLSTSRVILKIGREYWAVDLGQRLSRKRHLTGELLPPELRGQKRK